MLSSIPIRVVESSKSKTTAAPRTSKGRAKADASSRESWFSEGTAADEYGNDEEDLDGPVSRGRINENKTKVPVAKMERWINRPNVHIAAHYPMYANHFATLWNVCVPFGTYTESLFEDTNC